MNEEVKKTLAAIRDRLKYQAQAMTCSLSPADCKTMLQLVDDVERLLTPAETSCSKCGDVFDADGSTVCGSCV